MTINRQTSLVIVSRKRPQALRRVISSLRFQSHQNFEVIVVSDQANLEFCADIADISQIKHVRFNEANISKARNLGIDQSAGEIIAFCDDDAVPDPNWLARLTAAFDNQKVDIAGGFVRGRNGISYQWKCIETNLFGEDRTKEVNQNEISLHSFDGAYFVKVQGTNCAFRSDKLRSIKGFDPNYKFLFDETDVVATLSKAGSLTAMVPNAQVMHGFAESDYRTRSRTPKTLAVEAASKKRFLEKHAPAEGRSEAFEKFVEDQHARLVGFMVSGGLEPRRLRKMMKDLELQNQEKTEMSSNLSSAPKSDFVRFETSKSAKILTLHCRPWSLRKASDQAKERAKSKQGSMIFCLSPTALFHQRWFETDGYWIQKGGLFGKSNRDQPLFRFSSFGKRIKKEIESLSSQFDF